MTDIPITTLINIPSDQMTVVVEGGDYTREELYVKIKENKTTTNPETGEEDTIVSFFNDAEDS